MSQANEDLSTAVANMIQVSHDQLQFDLMINKEIKGLIADASDITILQIVSILQDTNKQRIAAIVDLL